MAEQVFYLGKRKHKEEDDADQKTGIRFGGAMPDFLENPDYTPRTEEQVSLCRALTEKHERKAMIVWRLLYLEKKRSELTSYMMDAEKRNNGADSKSQLLFLIFGGSLLLFSVIFFLSQASPGSALFLLFTIALLAIISRSLSNNSLSHRMAEWNRDLTKMLDEHRALEEEKKQLETEIAELEEKKEQALKKKEKTPQKENNEE
ncbi:MAG: hypothetical protein K6E50_02460 [Lachnospiraceae bacterium]|nr:hypothetical protein [Lachnospiraceae bacterium]